MIVRRAFTLVELLITISIIGIMSSMVVFAMFSAQEAAREQKTRMLITKLNGIIMQRYESYRTRRAPINTTDPSVTGNAALVALMKDPVRFQRARLETIRDLMRMEMPDRWSDVLSVPVSPLAWPAGTKITRPSVSVAYLNKYQAVVGNTNWPISATAPLTDVMISANQGAECLYMIVMESIAQEGDAREVFKAGDIGDTDGDGFPEFLDAWRRPIQFFRWAPGFQSPLQTPIRFVGNSTAGSTSQEVRVQVVTTGGKRLSQTPGSYVGGTLAFIDQNSDIIDTRSTATITGYTYTPAVPPANPTAVFTCSTPSYTQQKPFNGNMPSGNFAIMQPDPFDSRGVFPLYNPGASNAPTPDTSVPTYALYPLILSAGRDKAFGVLDDVKNTGGGWLNYASAGDEALNPFYTPGPGSEAFGLRLGSVVRTSSEQGWYKGCDLDNITNHNLSAR